MFADNIGPVSDHRRGEAESALVYPVFSRRAGGLSVGINLFPARKICNFDCPYCEVHHFVNRTEFDPERLRTELDAWAAARDPSLPVKDLCISGNGEPTRSPHLAAALAIIVAFRDRALGGRGGGTDIVLITNSTGFTDPGIAALLAQASARDGLRIWAKLDGATPETFGLLSGSRISFARTVAGIADFARGTPVTIQTMLCAVDGVRPAAADAIALGNLLAGLLRQGAMIDEIHLYTKARPDSHGRTEPLADDELRALGDPVARAVPVPVRIFGERGELEGERAGVFAGSLAGAPPPRPAAGNAR